jgi:hypothetical protein
MDLYDRLEELQGMTHLLSDDVTLLKPKVGELGTDEEKANRRSISGRSSLSLKRSSSSIEDCCSLESLF